MLNKKPKPPDNDESKEVGQYSRDVDQTRFLRMAFTLAMTVVIGLFLLEFFHKEDKAMLFTPEIVHILVNGLALAFFGLGTYIYGKSVGANQALAKLAGGNGGNGNGNQTENQQQTQQGGATAAAETVTEGDMADHSEVLNLILKSEGGLNENEPAHVGGVSYAGITQKTYDGWLAKYRGGTATPAAKANPPKSVRDLADRHDVVEAFYTDYFESYHTWELPEFLQYIYADFVVNAGSAAVKIIQRMVEVDDDGAWGSGTSKAVSEWKETVELELADDPNVDNELITEFHEQKLAHYNNLAEMNPTKFGQYLAGWKKRCNNVLSDLGKYFESDEPTPKALDENEPEQPAKEPNLSFADIQSDIPAGKYDLSDTPSIVLLEELAKRIK